MDDKKTYNNLDWLDKAARHDLENQITVIEGYQELERLGEETTIDEETISERIKDAKKEINNIYNEIREADERISFQDIMGKTYQGLSRERLPRAGKNVEINYHEEHPQATKEEAFHPAVQRMVYNLLENSIEHGTEDIEVEVYADNKVVEMEVYDGGELDQELVEEIFPGELKDTEPEASGKYIINRIAHDYNIDIDSPQDKDCYTVTMPKNGDSLKHS